jgi:hypothetical protein
MEGVPVGVEVGGVQVEDSSDFLAEKRQVQVEAGAEQDPVEILGPAATDVIQGRTVIRPSATRGR